MIKKTNLHVGAALNMLVVGYAISVKYQDESFNYFYRRGKIVGEGHYDEEEDYEYPEEIRERPEDMLKKWGISCANGWRVIE